MLCVCINYMYVVYTVYYTVLIMLSKLQCAVSIRMYMYMYTHTYTVDWEIFIRGHLMLSTIARDNVYCV